jgi:hypothetical protein
MRVLTFITMSMLSAALFAADVDFSGTWTLNKDKSEFPEMSQGRGRGGAARFAAANMTITQKKNKMTVERKRVGRDGEERITETKFDFKGKVTKEKGRRGTTEHVAQLKGIVLHVESLRFMERQGQEFEIVTTQKWSLVDGGVGLLIESSSETPMGNRESKAYYDKN